MRTLIKCTCFFILSFFFCLVLNGSNIKASNDYVYLDNGDEVSVNLEENNITTYGDFVTYIANTNNVPKSRITVYKWNDVVGWNLIASYNTFEGDNTVLLDILPTNTCQVTFDYEITIEVEKNETYKIYSNGHRLPNLSSLDKEGYVFEGWYTYINDEYVKIDVDEFYILKDSLVLYAEYTKKTDYRTWIIIGCIGFLAISSTVIYFMKKKENETVK